MTVEVGSEAPDFTLNDYNKQPVQLSSFRGDKPVLLVFYPFAFSGICTGELCQLRDEFADYDNKGVQILGVSVDTPFSLKAWSEKEGYQFPLLSDFWPHGEVAQAYGVFNSDAGLAVRGTFLIDTSGVVRFAEVNAPGEARDQQGWKKAVAELTA
ncbi:alkyl hydroperoxide reductase/thiol specific antioxidant [Amycolatopsis mediterranei S699]|uniref:Alkyl hydroperoxide reductase E n=2 Tax=Amycolatopsis mediterranei TaxID=33910 RepID=A0A0H3D303_AMYMU|nr:peroxiredoxin [Amycolatopsis mediterranei]ADJ43921.1 alkyl hydroperoxide reductase/thiol specific antioxidant [Amycolatopsis mediterranei U32]AEK40640.1 alkyl hydroperoxide reductase/thiol specific antioxidant [Amycolatopsis mediterranei S699]AFO75634.1 alkyl hydroperoxide reductase/thiol specific antioxidant [Amycolatopsis mediterranei S699]AGT82763.1 alkyl hydroperoxide reductase/thiol specific antioxidant [Amycolatopsis mediterranei RB]KDO04286.1 peroxiredoxin [Amycolatopsis mediterranei